ncbi:hypothetical protein AB4027_05910 [Alkalibacterium putridalgicola]|uniref:5-methylcytosine restriction system specificity protein McrC n=1 Tax=Alkalibacterium putridalgicola TaxID=426703 RepID=UPI0034CF3326
MKTTDNTSHKLEDITLSSEFLRKIGNKDLQELQQDNLFLFPPHISEDSSLSDNQKVIETNADIFKTTNIMGIVGYNQEQLFIGSRFDNGTNFFFYYLLKRVLNFNFLNLEVGSKNQRNYMDWLIYLFPKYLNESLKKGLYKEYRTYQYNDFNVRGTIDVKRQIKENVPFTGKMAYRSREYSYENSLIHLIRYTIEYIKKHKEYRKVLTHDAVTRENIKAIEEKSQNYQQQGLHQIYSHNLRKPVRHAYYFEYRFLQQLCLSILSQETVIHNKNGKDKLYGFLFDGAWLFEEYVNLLIQADFLHPKNKQHQNRQQLFGKQSAGKLGAIYPDFISKNENERIIADAKYKPFDNIYGKDYLQLLAYMYRFDSNKGFYIYPYQSSETRSHHETFHLLRGVNGMSRMRAIESDISVIKLGIQIPSHAETFKEFEVEMTLAETRFKNIIGEQTDTGFKDI